VQASGGLSPVTRVLQTGFVLFGLAAAAFAVQDRPQVASGATDHGPNVVPPTRASTVVLYDQYNNPQNAHSTSQDFEAFFDAFDSFDADDFFIPGGQTWSIEGVDVDGEYMGAGPAASFHVHFYADASTLPGALVCDRPANPFTNGPSAGDAVITLTSPCVLAGPGAYWVSVQSRQDFNPAGQWFWQNRSVQSGFPAAWQNPGDGFGTGCATWQVRTLCLPSIPGPDQVYRLNGVIVPVDLQDFSVED
jgi:hypothetical protein